MRSGRPERLWLFLAAACVVPALLDAAQTYMQGRLIGRGPISWPDVIWQGSEWLILGALTPITYVLGRRYPLRGPRLTRNVSTHIVGALVLCVGWAACGAALRLALDRAPNRISFGRYLASWILTSLPWSVFMYFAVLGCVYAFSYWVEARDREAQSARLAAQLAEARLGALRMQLHPHFLFNSLNAITVLVRDGRNREAERMLELLSEVLRQVLRTESAHEVSLGEELEFLRRYLAIEQVRFSDRLRINLSVDERLHDAAVPGFILQPLVENALRHGLAKRSGQGTLEIATHVDGDDLVLSVRDDGAGIQADGGQSGEAGVGLANTRERLTTLYGDAGKLTLEPASPRGTIATIRIPHRRLADGERRAGQSTAGRDA